MAKLVSLFFVCRDSEYHVYLGIINAFVEYDGGTCTAVHGVHGGLRLRLAQTLANILPVVFYGVSTRPYLTNVRTVKELRNAEKISLHFRNFTEEFCAMRHEIMHEILSSILSSIMINLYTARHTFLYCAILSLQYHKPRKCNIVRTTTVTNRQVYFYASFSPNRFYTAQILRK